MRSKSLAASAILAALSICTVDFAAGIVAPGVFGGEARAVVGRPLTPLSYAGVARRTTRRVVRRTAYRVNALPPGCIYGPYYGGNYYNCAGTYYEKSGNVYIQVVIE
jgi:hypothetical protein